MNSSNVFAQYDEIQREKRKAEAIQRSGWGIKQRSILVNLIEGSGGIISDHMYDLLLFNVNGLRVMDGKVYYLSFYRPSKKLSNLFAKYNKLIIENFDKIIEES